MASNRVRRGSGSPLAVEPRLACGVVEPASIGDPVQARLSHSFSQRLRRRVLRLEYATLAWNVVGSVIVFAAAVAARSVALVGFGLDSLIEILASLVVIWQLQDADAAQRERRALRIIGVAFLLLAAYISAQSIYVLLTDAHPRHSLVGIVWLALTAAAMFGLAAAKHRTGRDLGNRAVQTEARVTLIDGLLATAVLLGLTLNAAVGLWWADPAAAFVIVYYGAREGRNALHEAAL
jgi:divalent metal cation (Fe/Co/Zn/Cd) transporter